jgi:hypothetical protein
MIAYGGHLRNLNYNFETVMRSRDRPPTATVHTQERTH